MLEHKKIQNLNDYFVELNKRPVKGVYFYRINAYSKEIGDFIKKYYDATRRTGVVIEGKIPNPDEKNLSFYTEMMGNDFQMNENFISTHLKKWLSRMNDFQRQSVAASIYNSLYTMHKEGKTDNMLKNAYIKFMCWLYYKFERIVNQLGENNIPKILYEGDISHYELMLISILSDAGCDVVLLQYNGDAAYLKSDPKSLLSYNLELQGMGVFPAGYSLKSVRDEIQNDMNNERLYGQPPKLSNCTNAWITGKGFEDILKSPALRGTDERFFYNLFCRINGVEDRLTYVNDLFKLQQELRNSKRRLVIVNEEIPKPTPEEIAGIKRSNYAKLDQMILNIIGNIQYSANIELQKIMHKAFIDIILMESQKDAGNINKLTNKAVYLICWLKRYMPELFSNWKAPDIACFIYMGGCRDHNEALFISFLAKLPIDVLILCPNLNTKCCLEDKFLYEENYSETLAVDKYPEDNSHVRMGTMAYHAERDLDTIMYQDSGMYRNRQYGKANAISLQTMYEEIKILWDQELKYRPGFSTVNNVVNIPVIFAKVSGVKDGLIAKYWESVRELVTPDTFIIKKAPYIQQTDANPMKEYVAEFYKNGRLQTEKIKNHPKYAYGILRDDIQELIFDKLRALIEQKLIKNTGINGTEYVIIAQVLNLPKEIIRMIQNFDFTKKNPKLIYINTAETVISLEDSILTAFLNLIGFDIIFFVPTGYQSVERYFNGNIIEEHQIGEYKYDMQVPNLSVSSSGRRMTWREKLFGR